MRGISFADAFIERMSDGLIKYSTQCPVQPHGLKNENLPCPPVSFQTPSFPKVQHTINGCVKHYTPSPPPAPSSISAGA